MLACLHLCHGTCAAFLPMHPPRAGHAHHCVQHLEGMDASHLEVQGEEGQPLREFNHMVYANMTLHAYMPTPIILHCIHSYYLLHMPTCLHSSYIQYYYYICLCLHAHMLHTCLHAQKPTCRYTHTSLHAYMPTCTQAYMLHTCLHAYMHTCTHIHTQVGMHAASHT